MIYRAISSGMHFFDNSFIFPNYNDPKYTTSVVKTYLDKKRKQWDTISHGLGSTFPIVMEIYEEMRDCYSTAV